MAKNNPFENAISQLGKAAVFLRTQNRQLGDQRKLDQMLEILKRPQREVHVCMPLVMDDGTIKLFDGYRVQYNNARGPYKGGTRFHPQVSLDEMKALSFWMVMKLAVVGIPYGGGKGGVRVNPQELSKSELERLTRAYTRAITPVIGPEIDIPGPDVNTNETIMDWMADEFRKLRTLPAQAGQNSLRSSGQAKLKTEDKKKLKAVVTGKSIENGGSEGRHTATAQGALYVFGEVVRHLGIKPQATVAIQGFGNAGYYFAKYLHESGYRVVAVSDSKGGVYVHDGLDPDRTMQCKKEKGTVAGCYCKGSVCDIRYGRTIDPEELLALPVDVLIPAALENALHKGNAGRIQAKVIFELANGPTTPEADEIFRQKGIPVIPDILTNAGGVTVSYFEWKQNMENQKWTLEEVNKKLKTIMEKATMDVLAAAKKYKTDFRTAAFEIAIERVLKAIKV